MKNVEKIKLKDVDIKHINVNTIFGLYLDIVLRKNVGISALALGIIRITRRNIKQKFF